MTLDEAIQHCEEKSCGSTGCADEHRQLGEWLIELKNLKNKTMDEPKLTDGIGRTRLGLTYEQIQAIEKYVKRMIEYSLHPQNRWKPSEEQLKALMDSIQGLYACKDKNSLLDLYEQLKAL